MGSVVRFSLQAWSPDGIQSAALWSVQECWSSVTALRKRRFRRLAWAQMSPSWSRASCSGGGDVRGLSSDVSLCKSQEPGLGRWVHRCNVGCFGAESLPRSVIAQRKQSLVNSLCSLLRVDGDYTNLWEWDGIWRMSAFYWLRLRCFLCMGKNSRCWAVLVIPRLCALRRAWKQGRS